MEISKMKTKLKYMAEQCRPVQIEPHYPAELKQTADKWNAGLEAIQNEIAQLDGNAEGIRGKLLSGGKGANKDVASLQGRMLEIAANLRLHLIAKKDFEQPIRDARQKVHLEADARLQEARASLEAALTALKLRPETLRKAMHEDQGLAKLRGAAERAANAMQFEILNQAEANAIERLEDLLLEAV